MLKLPLASLIITQMKTTPLSKEQNYLKKTASFCIDLAKKLGATDVTAEVGHSISETVNFRNKKLDESDRSDSLAVGLPTYIGKKNLVFHHQILMKIILKP